MSNCRTCGAKIVWVKTTEGKNMPLDAAPVANGNIRLVKYGSADLAEVCASGTGNYVSHFATCPNAVAHRRER